MKEYDPESGTYQNVEIDPKTKEVRYGEVNPDEEEIVYKFKKIKDLRSRLHHKWWFWCICAFVLIAPWIVVLAIQHHNSLEQKLNKKEVKEVVKEIVKDVKEEVPDNNAGTLTIMDSSKNGDAYTVIIDTVYNGHQLHLYNVRYGIPELYVCDSTDIDSTDRNIVFAARAADFGKERELLGFFINKGEILATGSKNKEGFCAIINHNITLGAGKTTPLLEQAINEGGYFFRNPPLVVNGIPQELTQIGTTPNSRRALCSFNNEIVYIACDDQMTLTEFAQLLSDFGVVTAVNMVGSKGGHGFCRDQDGALHHWGVNRYANYKNVNYLVWKKK